MPIKSKFIQALRKDDRAESSIMTLISQNISLLIIAALAGATILLISGGARIGAENSAQAQVRIANLAFTTDVERAGEIKPFDDHRVSFVSNNFAKNASDQPVCRISQWELKNASEEIRQNRGDSTAQSLVNTIAMYPTASCEGTPSATQTDVAIDAVTTDSAFRYYNVAVRMLEFSNGVEYGFASGVGSADVQPRSDWYTQDEWEREIPRIVEAKLTAIFPMTAKTDATIKATSKEAPTELTGDNGGIITPPTDQTRWVPNPVDEVLVERSPTTGPIVGGEHEGLWIHWTARPIAECAPDQTITYSWLVTNTTTNTRTSGETKTTEVHMDSSSGPAEIWNGGNYHVNVSGRCNDTDGQSGDKAASYTLPLPNVKTFNVVAPGAQTTQTSTWEKVSSDPSLRYILEFSPANTGKYAAYNKVTTPNATSSPNVPAWMYDGMPWTRLSDALVDNSYVKSGGTVVQGHPDTYRVRAYTTPSPNDAGQWTAGNYTYIATAANPTIVTIGATSFSWSASSCSTNATAGYRAASSNIHGSQGVAPADTTGTAIGTTVAQSGTSKGFAEVNQGSRVHVRVQARCSTKFTAEPTNGQTVASLQPWSVGAAKYWDRPVIAPTTPANVRLGDVGVGNGSVATTGWDHVDCATGTVRDYFQRYTQVNASAGEFAGVWTAGNTRSLAHGEAPGSYYSWDVKSRCYSFATGTLMSNESARTGMGYYTRVPAPSVSISRSAASAVVGDSVYIGGSVDGCAPGTYGDWSSAPAGWVSFNRPYQANFSVAGRCIGLNNQASGQNTAGTNVVWYQPAPTAPSFVYLNGTWSPGGGTGGGYGVNSLSGQSGGSANASSYGTLVDINVQNRGWLGLRGSYSCVESASTVAGQGQAFGPGGSSGWTSTSMAASSLVRTNQGCW